MAQESDREPGLLALAVHGVKLVGVRGALQTVRYGRRKARLDERYLAERPTGPEVRAGSRGEATVADGVVRIPFGQLELEVAFVLDGMVRLTWTPGRLPVPAAVDPSGPASVLPAEVTDDGDDLAVDGAGLRVVVGADGGVTVLAPGADGLRVVRRERPPVRTGERWTATVELEPDDRVHGLGERSAGFDLRPGTYGLWNTEQSGSYGPEADPLYLTIPVALVVAPGRCHLSFWENSHRGEVVVGDAITVTFEGGALRTYVSSGVPAMALDRYQTLTGTSPLPPRWALGYHQCRWGYKTEADIREVAAGFDEHDLPLSAIHLDIDYMDRYRVFTVDTEDFPDLPGLLADLEADGIKAVTILDPGVAKAEDFPLFREGRDEGRFLRLPDRSLAEAVVWPGLVGFPDFSDPEVRAWWAEQYPALLDQGVAGIWHDMCEPAVFSAMGDASLPLATRHHLEGRGGDHVEGRNLYGQGMAQAGHEAMAVHRPDRRPWLLTRSGWAGIQRYAWTWTGDVATSWTMLHRTLCTTLNLSLSGVPYTGPDIGGFSGDPSPELYTRWFQLSAWLPFFRSHSIFTMPSREPWKAAGPHLDAVREAATGRERLLPYLYTCAHEVAAGLPFTRPVWWPGSDDPALLAVDDELLVGEHVLVAPVFEPAATSREVVFPPGVWWSLHDGTAHDGTGTVPVTMDRIPAFARAGAVLPTDEDGRSVLHLYAPDRPEARSTWYRDAGEGYGPGRTDGFHVTLDADTWSVRREVIQWGVEAFEVDDADLTAAFHTRDAVLVEVDGAPAQHVEPGQSLRVGAFTELTVRRPG